MFIYIYIYIYHKILIQFEPIWCLASLTGTETRPQAERSMV